MAESARPAPRSPIRWGILGPAQIARKNWQAIYHSGNGVVAGVASRDRDRSAHFIAQCQAHCRFEPAPRAFGSYQELLDAESIDAVYLPLPTGVRKDWVLRAAAAGKHILSEKPCGATAADLEEMLAACQKHRVQFMDGVMFMHSRRLPLLRQVLDDGTSVGPLRRITSAFTFNGGDDFFAGNIRAEPSLEPLGCLGDLGWYCVRLSLWAMNWQMPRSVHGTLLAEARRPGAAIGVPIDLSAELRFDGGVSAGFHCSFVTGGQQWAMLTGTQGYVQMSDFTLPDFSGRVGFELVKGHYQVERCDITTQNEFIRHSVAERSNSHATAQESNMFRAFGAQILTGELSDFWPEIAWKTQRVVDACIESARRDRDA